MAMSFIEFQPIKKEKILSWGGGSVVHKSGMLASKISKWLLITLCDWKMSKGGQNVTTKKGSVFKMTDYKSLKMLTNNSL